MHKQEEPYCRPQNLGLVHRVSFAVMAVAGLGSELMRLNWPNAPVAAGL